MEEDKIIKLSKLRFVILICYWALIGLQFGSIFEYAIIANIVMKYYDVSMNAVNVATVSGSILYVILLLPSTYAIKRFGVRKNVIIGASFLFFGSLVKCFSVRRDLFAVAVVGNFISAASMSFSYPLYLQIPRIWFPSGQLSTITSIIYSSAFIGFSLVAFTIAQVIPEEADATVIEPKLLVFMIAQASVACVILLSLIVFFKEKPKYLPSAAEVQAAQNRSSLSYWQSVKKTMNKNFMLVLAAATISMSVMLAYSNIRNQIFTQFFTKKVAVLGTMTLVSSIFSVVSMIGFGFLFDKYKCYKSTFVVSTVALCVINIVYYIGLHYEIIEVVFIAKLLEAVMMNGILGLYYLAPEINYPLPESISATMFSTFEQIAAFLLTFILTSIVNEFGTFAVYAFITSMCVMAIICIACAKIELKRTAVEVALHEAKQENEDM